MRVALGSPEYISVHLWLHENYGKANKCSNKSCLGISKNYQWAKKHGYAYKKARVAFKMLCVSCHQKYDKNTKRIARLDRNRRILWGYKNGTSINYLAEGYKVSRTTIYAILKKTIN